MIGKWEKVNYGNYPFLAKCSRCGHEIDTHYEGKYPNFCSNCGLSMNEEAARRLNTDLSDGLDESVIQKVLNKRCMTAVTNDYLAALHGKSSQDEWIPITFRQADDEEYEKTREVYDSYWADLPREECKVYDCRMPDDGQEVLITTSWGAVCEDTYHADDVLAGFEDHDDPDDVIAWMPKPGAYKKEDAE